MLYEETSHSASPQWRRVGRYELGPRLAKGGMAELCLARATGVHGFQKYVVVKRILPKWADDREFVEMFLDEARLAAQLDHANVVHVHDIGDDDGGPFFAMDYIHGESLLELFEACRTQQRTLEWSTFVAIASAAAAGLHHAHERRGFDGKPLGIIHRDVSPTNIIAGYEGALKLVDFGIAKAATSRHATRPSMRKGKMAYMSPEQCKGEPLDRRSDLFALGIVLYELATLTRAFSADSEFAVMNRIVNHDAEKPSTRRPDIPQELEAILERLLQRDRDRRYDNAQQVQRDLDAYAAQAGLVATPNTIASTMAALFGTRPFPWETLGEGSVSSATPQLDRRNGSASADAVATAVTAIQPAAARHPPRVRRAWAAALGLVIVGAAGVAWSARDTPVSPLESRPDTTAKSGPAAAHGGIKGLQPKPARDPRLPGTADSNAGATDAGGPAVYEPADGSVASARDAAEPRDPPDDVEPPHRRSPKPKSTSKKKSRPRTTHEAKAEPSSEPPPAFDPDAPAPRPR